MNLPGDCGVAASAAVSTAAAKVLATSLAAGASAAGTGTAGHRRLHHHLPRSSYNNTIPDDQYSTAVPAVAAKAAAAAPAAPLPQPLSQKSPGQGGQQLAASAEDQDQNKQLTTPLLPFASPSDKDGLGVVDSKDCIDVLRPGKATPLSQTFKMKRRFDSN